MKMEDDNGVPIFAGVLLKDGTELKYLANGVMNGYTDETMQAAFDLTKLKKILFGILKSIENYANVKIETE